jgi:hypothetical protein
MTAGYLLFLIVGRLFIFLGNKFVENNEIKIKFLNKLLSCPLCLGVWVYTILSAITGYYVFEDFVSYKIIFSELAAGCFSAALVYYVEMGWRSLHEVIVV